MTVTHARHALLLALGFAVGGWFGLVVAGLGLVAMQRSWQQALWLPAALVSIAALTTVLPDVPTNGSLRPSFATDRPLAAAAGLAAGILLTLLLVESTSTGRAASTTTAVERGPGRGRPGWTTVLNEYGPMLAAALTAAVLRLVVGGEALSGAEADAVAILRSGGGFTVSLPPVAVALAATSPIGTNLLTALLAASLVVAVALLAQRIDGSGTARVAAIVAALLPLTWALPLSATVGLLAVLLGLIALWEPAPADGRTIIGGLLLGLGVLARPEMALLALAALVWCALRRHPLEPARFIGVIIVFGVTLAPWMTHVRHRTGTPNLADPLNDAIEAIGSAVGGPGIATITVIFMAAAVVAALQERPWLARQLTEILPLVAGAFLAVVLLAVSGGAVALYPAVPLTALVLARGLRQFLEGRNR